MNSLPTLTGFLDAQLPLYGLPGPSNFRFVSGETSLSTWPVVLSGCMGYLALIFGIQTHMRLSDAKPLQLRGLFVAHNLALVAVSAILLYEMLRIVGSHWATGGIYHAMCAAESFGGGLEFWYYRGLITVARPRPNQPADAYVPSRVDSQLSCQMVGTY